MVGGWSFGTEIVTSRRRQLATRGGDLLAECAARSASSAKVGAGTLAVAALLVVDLVAADECRSSVFRRVATQPPRDQPARFGGFGWRAIISRATSTNARNAGDTCDLLGK